MGIDSKRFIGKTHEPFICAVCLDVAEDPIMTPCEHVFCKACFTSGRCPTCRTNVNRCAGINRVLKYFYGSLVMSCSYHNCNDVFELQNHKSHDASCPKRDGNCDKCGYNYTAGVHDCVSNLKDKVTALELQAEQFKLAQDVEGPERVKCALVFKSGANVYACATCCRADAFDEYERNRVFYCEQCYNNGNHRGHDVEILAAGSNRLYCDCGDENLIKSNGVRCRLHRFRNKMKYNRG